MFAEQIKGVYKQNLENFDMDEPSQLVIFSCYSYVISNHLLNSFYKLVTLHMTFLINSSTEEISLCLIYRGGNSDTEDVCKLHKVTQHVIGRARILNQSCVIPKPEHFFLFDILQIMMSVHVNNYALN